MAASRRQLGAAGEPSSLNLRTLAAELGVTAMALYRHVAGKEGLLELITDDLLRESVVPPDPPVGQWREWMRTASIGLFDLISTSPTVAFTFSTRPVVSEAALTRMEATLRVLTAAGFDPHGALAVFAELHAYTVGFATVAATRGRHGIPGGESAEREWGAFFRSLDPTCYPMLVALAPDLAYFTSRDQFCRGLDLRLDAHQAWLTARHGQRDSATL